MEVDKSSIVDRNAHVTLRSTKKGDRNAYAMAAKLELGSSMKIQTDCRRPLPLLNAVALANDVGILLRSLVLVFWANEVTLPCDP
jgi:hypothetical protein